MDLKLKFKQMSEIDKCDFTDFFIRRHLTDVLWYGYVRPSVHTYVRPSVRSVGPQSLWAGYSKNYLA